MKDCNRYMFTNQLNCDVTFLVGPEKTRIGAHKYILGSRSSVFFEMFHEGPSGNAGPEIEVTDVTAGQFNKLMEYLYTEDVEIDLNNVQQVLDVARKYNVHDLIDKCLYRLNQHMMPENVCKVMETAHMCGDLELRNKCLQLILTEPGKIFMLDEFADLCQECLAMIIQDDSFSIEEEAIFNAVLKYARAKCVKRNLVETPENLQEMVKDVIPHVRFPLMNHEFVTETVDPSGLLTEQQTLTIYRYFARNKTGEMVGFSSRRRKMVLNAQRFRDLGSGKNYKKGKLDAVTFSSSMDILVKGIQIYGSCQGPGDLKATVHVKQEPYGAVVTVQRMNLATDGKQQIYSLFFDNPAPVKKDKLYTIILAINSGPPTFYGTKGQKEVFYDNLKITFQGTASSTNETNEEQGQIPGIIFEIMPEPTGS